MNTISEEVKVLIVEDEFVIAETIKVYLEMSGYKIVNTVTTADEALEYCNMADCVIIDIGLDGSKDGIWLAEQIQEHYRIPYLFLTSHSDAKTIAKVTDTSTYGFLSKPIEKNQLIAAVELMLAKHKQITSYETEIYNNCNIVFLKNVDKFSKIDLLDICYVESQKNYLLIVTSKSVFKHRSTIKEFIELLPPDKFIKTHRAFIVNVNAIESVDKKLNTVVVKNNRIPVSRSYRKHLAYIIGR